MADAAYLRITGIAQKTAWDNKTFPPVEEIGNGAWSIPVPFPGNPLRYTLCYVLSGDSGAVVVDPGWDSDQGWESLLAGLRMAGVALHEVGCIAVTHYHPDHSGMTTRLRNATGAAVAMGADEYWPPRSADLSSQIAADLDQLKRWGVPEERLAETTILPKGIEHLPDLRAPDLRLSDAQLLPLPGRSIRTVATPGHTPGHICLLDEDNQLLLTGDHVLPRISPHISLERGGLANPLAVYLASLAALAGHFPDDESDVDWEVCPAHEYRFRGIRERIAILDLHNRERSAEVVRALDSCRPTTAWDVAKELHWSRGWDSLHGLSLRFAVAETASHLVYLQAQGRQTGVEAAWA